MSSTRAVAAPVVMPGRHLPPDPSAGDEHTLGGYMAVHARPAAFQGADGLSYSVEILTDATDGEALPWGAYLLFVRWRRIGSSGVEGHLESDFVAFGHTEAGAREGAGRLSLHETKALLDALLRDAEEDADAAPSRPWWEVMRDEDDDASP